VGALRKTGHGASMADTSNRLKTWNANSLRGSNVLAYGLSSSAKSSHVGRGCGQWAFLTGMMRCRKPPADAENPRKGLGEGEHSGRRSNAPGSPTLDAAKGILEAECGLRHE
jgi:hypothetical protein